MITPKYRTKKNGVPILSKKEIYAIAEDFVGDFQPAALVNPQPIDVEAFLELYLGMTPDFQYLSHIAVQFRHRHLVSERLQVKFKLLSQFYHIYTELHSGFCVKS